jgi:Zn-dependent protease with chaperone function
MSETPVTYLQLFEKYAKRDQQRNILSAVMGTLGAAGVVLAVLRLRELKADRAAVRTAVVRNAARRGASS